MARINTNQRFDRKIRIQQVSETQSTSGSIEETWVDFATVYARLEETKGREGYIGAREFGRLPVMFTIRYLEGVNEKMRVLFRDKAYDILNISEITRRRFMEISCELRE